jgi:hypothetical protein
MLTARVAVFLHACVRARLLIVRRPSRCRRTTQTTQTTPTTRLLTQRSQRRRTGLVIATVPAARCCGLAPIGRGAGSSGRCEPVVGAGPGAGRAGFGEQAVDDGGSALGPDGHGVRRIEWPPVSGPRLAPCVALAVDCVADLGVGLRVEVSRRVAGGDAHGPQQRDRQLDEVLAHAPTRSGSTSPTAPPASCPCASGWSRSTTDARGQVVQTRPIAGRISGRFRGWGTVER